MKQRIYSPKVPAVLYEFGMTTFEMDLVLDALPVFEQLPRDDPNEPAYRAAAIEIFRQVTRVWPDHAAAFSALGAAYREEGSYTEARVAPERAVELQANDLRANYQLGLVYSRLGDKEAAKKMFARADDRAAASATKKASFES